MPARNCYIPMCPNTSANTRKLFISVPRDYERRRKWMAIISKHKFSFSMMYCCEDHFNLEEDAQNWMYFKTMGSSLVLKKNVVPHRNIDQEEIVDAFKSQLSVDDLRRKKMNIEKLHQDDNLRKIPQRSIGVQTCFENNYVEIEENLHKIEFVNIDTIKSEIKAEEMTNIELNIPEENVLHLNNIEVKYEEIDIKCEQSDFGCVRNSFLDCSVKLEQCENNSEPYLCLDFNSDKIQEEICCGNNVYFEHNYCKIE